MRTLRSLLCTAWLAWLTACGPGTGGTGTGETGSIYFGIFGASASSVCASSFATALSCADTPTGVDPPTPAANTGSLAVHFTDRASGGATDLTIDGHTARLDARCAGLRFDGDWGIAAVSGGRFYGSYGSTASAAPTAATLAVDAVPGTRAVLRVTLRQADGSVVLGPLELSRVMAPVGEPAVCR